MSYCEWPEFYNESFPKAKKKYKCVECYAPIEVGEKHLYYRGKWDNEFSDGRQHMLCRELCMKINRATTDRNTRDECFAFGDLYEEWAECDLGNNRDKVLRKDWRDLFARIKARDRKHRTRRKRVNGVLMKRKLGETEWSVVPERRSNEYNVPSL